MIKLGLAVFVTLTAEFMTAVAAWDRGGTMVDKALLVAMSVVIVLAVHLLLAISRRPAAWLVWAGCLLCAIYGHLTFLTHASLRAGDNRAQQSALTVGTERQVEVTREALANIQARAVTTVAAELATSSDRRARAALREEIADGKRAGALRGDLVRLSGVLTGANVSGAVDPVTARLSVVTGWSESEIAVVIDLTFSILLEMIGALVWVEALRPSSGNSIKVTPFTLPVTTRVTGSVTPATTHVTTSTTTDDSSAATYATNQKTTDENNAETTPVTDSESDPVTKLKVAIQSGKCRATVNGIREFLGCSQNRALELRRELT